MWRFIKEISAFAAVIIVFLSLSAFYIPSCYIKNSMLCVQTKKVERLEKLPGKRIVFVGGSNLSQGLNSKMIEEECGLPVVNMGLHAGLGVRYNLKVAENGVRAGDIVVLALEYNTCHQAGYGDDVLLAMVCDIMPKHKKHLDVCDWIHILRYIPTYGAKKYLHFFKFLTHPRKDNYADYNEQGDHRPELRPCLDKGLCVQNAMDETNYSGKILNAIRDFKVACEKKGARVVMMPPVLMKSSYENRKSFVKAIADSFKDAGFQYVVKPEEFALPDNLFYNSADHLNIDGVPVRTMKVINILLPIINENNN